MEAISIFFSCYSWILNTLLLTFNRTCFFYSHLNLKHGKGDCDSDEDCQGTLLCLQRDSSDTDPVPGCTGEPIGANDYCYGNDPTLSPTKIPTSVPTKAPTSLVSKSEQYYWFFSYLWCTNKSFLIINHNSRQVVLPRILPCPLLFHSQLVPLRR